MSSLPELAVADQFSSVDYKHICIKTPCAYCQIRAGHAISGHHTVSVFTPAKRMLVDQLLETIPKLDERQLTALNFIVKAYLPDEPTMAAKPAPEGKERKVLPFALARCD